jgi:hypothetical protein
MDVNEQGVSFLHVGCACAPVVSNCHRRCLWALVDASDSAYPHIRAVCGRCGKVDWRQPPPPSSAPENLKVVDLIYNEECPIHNEQWRREYLGLEAASAG